MSRAKYRKAEADNYEVRWFCTARHIVSVLGYSFAVSVPALLISAAYFGNPVTWLLSFSVEDGWCNAATEGIGRHCFGDFQFNRLVLNQASVWRNQYQVNVPYLPVGLWPNWLSDAIGDIGMGVRGSLIVYLALLAIALITPAAWAAWRLRVQFPPGIILATTGFMTLPFFVVLDRGNNLGFAVPPLLGFFIGLRNGPRWLSPACFVVASLLRPQYAVICLAFLVVNRSRDAVLSVLGFLISIPISFVLWSGLDWQHSMAGWFDDFTSFSDGQSPLAGYPTNLSASRTLVVAARSLNLFSSGAGDTAATYVSTHATAIGLLVVAVSALSILIGRRRSSILVCTTLLLAVSILAPGVVYPYYLQAALVLVALVLVWSSDSTDAKSSSSTSEEIADLPLAWRVSLIATLVVSLVPIPFAFSDGYQSIGLVFSGPMWFVLWLLSVIQVISTSGLPRSDSRSNADFVESVVR